MCYNTFLLIAAKPDGKHHFRDQEAHKRSDEKKLGLMARLYNPTSWEGEAGGGGAYVNDL